MSENDVLLEEVSPHGNFQALVEATSSVVYFYLWPPELRDEPPRACWVRNLREAPVDLDVAAMERGEAPMLPRAHCVHPQGSSLPDREKLRVVWFEEGDAAALLEGDEILAVIPSWSGAGGFHGYARDCHSESTLCWPLGARGDNVMYERVAANEAYWTWWESDPWTPFQTAALAEIDRHLGKETRYFVIDQNEWPPKALVMATREVTTLVTIGVSLRAQPAVEMAVEDPSKMRRFELAFAMQNDLVDPMLMAQYISAQTNLPWHELTWLGDGHTIPCDVLQQSRAKTRFDAMLLVKHPPAVPDIRFDRVRGEEVNLFWLIPITEVERELAMSKGSAELTKRLFDSGVTGVFRDRRDVTKGGVLGFLRR